MSEANAPIPANGGPVEAKTKAGALGAYVGAFLLLSIVSSIDTDMINSLPDWVETPVYSLLASAGAFLAAYVKAHRPGQLSTSALRAARRTI